LTHLDLDLAQLGHDLLGLYSNTFGHNLILSKDKNTQFLSLTLDQFLNAGQGGWLSSLHTISGKHG
jgi:hypothetical protein